MTVFRTTPTVGAALLLSLAVAALPAAAADVPPAGALAADATTLAAPLGGAPGAAQLSAAYPGGDRTALEPVAEDPSSPKKLFTISDRRVVESSGLAKSGRHEGIWWTMNDSGDSARIFAVNTDGEVEAVITFGAEVRDLEAIAVGEDGTIYVGDIGDNTAGGAVRDFISVYRIAEPEVLESRRLPYRRYDFAYPDGPRDAETMLLHPRSGRFYFVSKTKTGPAAFYAAPADPSTVGVNDLKRIAAAPAGITDGTFLPDASRVVLRSYVDIAAFSWTAKPKLQGRATVPLALGESVAVGPTNTSVVVGSEGRNSVVYQVRVPTARSTASPTVKPAAAPAAGKKNHNMRWILIGSGAFALLVAIITFPVGRREREEALLEHEPDGPPPRHAPYGGEPPAAW